MYDMALHRVLILLLVLNAVGAGCLAPIDTDQQTTTESPTEEQTTSRTDKKTTSRTDEQTTSRLYGPCSLTVDKINTEGKVPGDEPERRMFEELSADQKAEFLGNATDSENGTDWDTSIRYVQYEGEWYSTLVECP